jgi:hypothetical protein
VAREAAPLEGLLSPLRGAVDELGVGLGDASDDRLVVGAENLVPLSGLDPLPGD